MSKIYFVCVHKYFDSTYVCVLHLSGPNGVQRKVPDPLELKLHMVLSLCMFQELILCFWQEQQVLLTNILSLQPWYRSLLFLYLDRSVLQSAQFSGNWKHEISPELKFECCFSACCICFFRSPHFLHQTLDLRLHLWVPILLLPSALKLGVSNFKWCQSFISLFPYCQTNG